MESFQRILISRTDRIGDVLLSTPVIKTIRRNFPHSYVAVMVRPYVQDIVLGNPYLDEVIIYDKYGRHHSLWRSLKFAWTLRRKKFDLALILHPTNRIHLLTFLAGIKRRVGFNKKMGFLLTDKISHQKQEGRKNESEYTLDLIRSLGIQSAQRDLFMPIRKDSEMFVDQLLADAGVQKTQRLIAVHPGASCLSKIWPAERFAQVANQLAREFKAKIVVVAGQENKKITRNFLRGLDCVYVDVSGGTTVSQLASVIKRCCLFISNDSGPVHIAVALAVPVVAIFGRKQPGLSPQRWGPQGGNDIILHKDPGCTVCLAHTCQKEFQCLQAISVSEVLSAARKLLASS